MTEDEVEIVVSVNGRVRSHFIISRDASKEQLEARAMELVPETPKKIITIPGKLVNMVV